MRPYRHLLPGLLIALLVVACSSPPQPTESSVSTPIKLYLGFMPNVQFAPFYVGIDKGFFATHGLEVSLEHKPESESVRLVATQKDPITMAVVSGEQVLLAREQDIPIVYVFEWYDRFPVALASKAELGIKQPADLAGHSVGTPLQEGASYIGLEALLFSAGLSDADIDLQVTGFTQVETLMTDRVEVVVVYIANEPIQLAAQGVDVNLITVSDYADLVSNGLIVSEALIGERPEIVRAMTAAFSEALDYAIQHPDEAFEIAKGFVEGLDDPTIEAAQREVLARSIELWRAERLGETDPAAWQSMQNVLIEMGLLSGPQDLEAAFTNAFLP